MTSLDPFVHDDAAYVLGALSSDERAAFERHLATCPDCTDRVREMASMPALLAGVPASAYSGDEEDEEEPPADLLPHLLSRVRFEQRRRRWVTTGLAGLAAACLVALAVAVWPSSSPRQGTGTSVPRPQAMSEVSSSPVHATAAVTSVAWGTKIDLVCEYYLAVTHEWDYQLVVIDKANVAHPAGSWKLVPGKVAHFTGGTSLTRDQISKVEITRGTRAILQLTL